MASKLERLQRQYVEHLEKAQIAKAELVKIRKEQDRKARSAARKARNHSLFQAGTIVELSGLLNADRDALLGGLLAIAKVMENPDSPRYQEWRASGKAFLTAREKQRAEKPHATDAQSVQGSTQGSSVQQGGMSQGG